MSKEEIKETIITRPEIAKLVESILNLPEDLQAGAIESAIKEMQNVAQ